MNAPHAEGGARLFGTDGVRGAFGVPPLDRATVLALGTELGAILTANGGGDVPVVILGGDTRDSTPTLCSWLTTGLRRAGCAVRYAGVVPTPAVARLVRREGAAAGIAVSASHNPHPDNGIKLIDPEGFKWSPAAEAELEAAMAQHRQSSDVSPETSVDPLAEEPRLVDAYLAELRAQVDPRALDGFAVTLDMANGAASALGEGLFTSLGARVTALGNAPDGTNINRGVGSTHPDLMARKTAESGSAIGFAFDGDADRVIVADETGRVRDGDALLFLLATSLRDHGGLTPPRIVATSMSNLGLEVALARHGIEVVRCDVGDRVVVETLKREGLQLGGEQSGHIVHLEKTPTGDGLLTALLTAEIVAKSGRALSELLRGIERFPQVLRNVRVRSKPDLMSLPPVAAAAVEVEERLGDRGRLVLRYSGTEPLARVMIEGPDLEEVERLTGLLVDAIANEIGANE